MTPVHNQVLAFSAFRNYIIELPMDPPKITIRSVALTSAVTHTVTYFVEGLLAMTLLRSTDLYAHTSLNLLMRPVGDNLVMTGPLFQPLQGDSIGR